MGRLVVKVPVTESEAGWGRKIDDHMVCLTMEDALAFTKEFNAQNTAESAPDWYMVVEHDPEPIDLNEAQYDAVAESEGKRQWLSNIKGF